MSSWCCAVLVWPAGAVLLPHDAVPGVAARQAHERVRGAAALQPDRWVVGDTTPVADLWWRLTDWARCAEADKPLHGAELLVVVALVVSVVRSLYTAVTSSAVVEWIEKVSQSVSQGPVSLLPPCWAGQALRLLRLSHTPLVMPVVVVCWAADASDQEDRGRQAAPRTAHRYAQQSGSALTH